MAITTADQLRTAVANWVNNTILVTDRQNECIALAEAMLNRVLRMRAMEETMASTSLSSGAASLPTGFLAFKELRFDGTRDYTLQPKNLEWIRAQDDTNTGDAQYFAVTGTQVVCWPPTGPIKGTYYKSLTSLTGLTSTGNWLLTAHPDLYLSATLTEAWLFLFDEEKAAMWRERTRALIEEIQFRDNADSLDGGVLAVRAR